MNVILWQSKDMPLFYEALRDQFNRGDTVQSMLITAGVFALLIGVVIFLTRVDRKSHIPEEPDHPARVFRETLHKLGFPPSQQRVFEEMVSVTKPAHPSALLLSEKLYDEHVTKWHSKRGSPKGDPDHKLLVQARTRLFPSGVGWISSGPERV